MSPVSGFASSGGGVPGGLGEAAGGRGKGSLHLVQVVAERLTGGPTQRGGDLGEALGELFEAP
ncbi:MAG: hypothetical protein ACRDYC_13430 [Acidimicrobiales bacterium]